MRLFQIKSGFFHVFWLLTLFVDGGCGDDDVYIFDNGNYFEFRLDPKTNKLLRLNFTPTIFENFDEGSEMPTENPRKMWRGFIIQLLDFAEGLTLRRLDVLARSEIDYRKCTKDDNSWLPRCHGTGNACCTNASSMTQFKVDFSGTDYNRLSVSNNFSWATGWAPKSTGQSLSHPNETKDGHQWRRRQGESVLWNEVMDHHTEWHRDDWHCDEDNAECKATAMPLCETQFKDDFDKRMRRGCCKCYPGTQRMRCKDGQRNLWTAKTEFENGWYGDCYDVGVAGQPKHFWNCPYFCECGDKYIIDSYCATTNEVKPTTNTLNGRNGASKTTVDCLILTIFVAFSFMSKQGNMIPNIAIIDCALS